MAEIINNFFTAATTFISSNKTNLEELFSLLYNDGITPTGNVILFLMAVPLGFAILLKLVSLFRG